jgi:hypothetical protein
LEVDPAVLEVVGGVVDGELVFEVGVAGVAVAGLDFALPVAGGPVVGLVVVVGGSVEAPGGVGGVELVDLGAEFAVGVIVGGDEREVWLHRVVQVLAAEQEVRVELVDLRGDDWMVVGVGEFAHRPPRVVSW